MTARNDITGADIRTKTPSEAYREGWERVYGNGAEKGDESVTEALNEVIVDDTEALNEHFRTD